MFIGLHKNPVTLPLEGGKVRHKHVHVHFDQNYMGLPLKLENCSGGAGGRANSGKDAPNPNSLLREHFKLVSTAWTGNTQPCGLRRIVQGALTQQGGAWGDH